MHLRIDGLPKPQGSKRVFNGRIVEASGNALKVWRKAIADACQANVNEEHKLLVGPVRVEVSAVFARPGRLFRQLDPDGRVPHDKRPDLDNVLKAILDGVDQAGVWGDDGQVCELAATQRYGRIVGERRDRTSEDPHVVVRVWRVV